MGPDEQPYVKWDGSQEVRPSSVNHERKKIFMDGCGGYSFSVEKSFYHIYGIITTYYFPHVFYVYFVPVD